MRLDLLLIVCENVKMKWIQQGNREMCVYTIPTMKLMTRLRNCLCLPLTLRLFVRDDDTERTALDYNRLQFALTHFTSVLSYSLLVLCCCSLGRRKKSSSLTLVTWWTWWVDELLHSSTFIISVVVDGEWWSGTGFRERKCLVLTRTERCCLMLSFTNSSVIMLTSDDYRLIVHQQEKWNLRKESEREERTNERAGVWGEKVALDLIYDEHGIGNRDVSVFLVTS